jgi:hypothetical protein
MSFVRRYTPADPPVVGLKMARTPQRACRPRREPPMAPGPMAGPPPVKPRRKRASGLRVDLTADKLKQWLAGDDPKRGQIQLVVAKGTLAPRRGNMDSVDVTVDHVEVLASAGRLRRNARGQAGARVALANRLGRARHIL